MLSITPDKRLFGADAMIESSRYPENTFSAMNRYLGIPYDEEMIAELKAEGFVMNEFSPDDRGLVGWKVIKKEDASGEDEILYTEELIAMILKYGKNLAEKQADG